MPLAWPNKDPDEVLDYVLDWSDRLDGDTILSSTWEVPTGITKDSDSATGDKATIWLSGGALGDNYTLVNRVTTAAGRTMDQSVKLKVRTR